MTMAFRLLRVTMAGALLWMGAHVCLMPQADCESHSAPPCHCHHGNLPRCCSGVHLVEAGVASDVSIAATQQPISRAVAANPGLSPRQAADLHQNFLAVNETPPEHSPPRECFGRSPPTA